jgi:hypothetical protein
MQKKYLGLVGFLIFSTILLSGCGTNLNKQLNTSNQGQTVGKPTEVINPSGEYTINELFAMNRPMKCTWKESGEKSDVTNIIYLNGKKMCQDVTMGDAGHSYMVSDGEWLFMWNDFTGMASKMKITEIGTGITPGQGKTNGTAGMDQKRDFVCESWKVDNSVFEPPKDKSFKDVTEEMTQAVSEIKNGGLEKAKQQMCDLCSKAPSQELKDE